LLAACSASPTSPSALANSPGGIAVTSLADPTLSGTAYQLTAVTSTTMSFANNQNTLTVPFDSSTTFRRAQLNLYAPSDPYLDEATAYNSATTVDASVLSTFIGGNARIIVQRLPDPIRILSFQPIPTVGSGGGPCTPGAPGCGWSNGDMRTFTQNSYGDSSSSGGAVVGLNFSPVYGGAGLTIGATNTLRFTNANAVFTYLPAVGPAGPLTGSLTDPITSSSGELGGEVLALQLNVDFSAANVITSAVDLGSLRFCNFSAVPSLNGQTVANFLASANVLLGGGGGTLSASLTASVAAAVNSAFLDGVPSTFAQESLVAGGTCP
jgi:hypothetical protein